MNEITLYTDGGASGNPGRGGWGVLLLLNGQPWQERYGAADDVTNNQMEITAAIEALKLVEAGDKTTLYSDSQYVIYTMTRDWKRNKNRDLWALLDEEVTRVGNVEFEWLRGHDGHRWQERAHELSMKAR